MEEWTKATLKQAQDDLEKKVTADLAKLREIINRKPVLPETMDIRIIGLINTADGPRERETGVTHLHRVTDIEVTVQPTSTVGDIKDFIFQNMPNLEYNQIEIEFWGVDLPDMVTVQQICNKWPFMKAKILHLHIFFRNATFKKLYTCFMGMGISKQNAKNQTKAIMQNFKDKGIDIKMGLGEAKARMQAEKIIGQTMGMSTEDTKEIIKTIAKFFRNKHVDINVFGTSKEKAKPSTNNIVESFQKRFSTNVPTQEKEEVSTNNIVDSFQKKILNANEGTSKETSESSSHHNNVNTFKITFAYNNVGKENTNTSGQSIADTFENKNIDSNLGNKQKANEPANKTDDTNQNEDVDTEMEISKEKKTTKQTMGKMNTLQDNGVDTSMGQEKTKKENKDKMDNGIDEKQGKLVVNLKDSLQKVVDREKEITEKLNICRARHLELRKLFPPLPRSPDQG